MNTFQVQYAYLGTRTIINWAQKTFNRAIIILGPLASFEKFAGLANDDDTKALTKGEVKNFLFCVFSFT